MIQGGLAELAGIAVRRGQLPADPSVLQIATCEHAAAACSLCTRPLDDSTGFELREKHRTVVLDPSCFSAWLDAVVTPGAPLTSRDSE